MFDLNRTKSFLEYLELHKQDKSYVFLKQMIEKNIEKIENDKELLNFDKLFEEEVKWFSKAIKKSVFVDLDAQKFIIWSSFIGMFFKKEYIGLLVTDISEAASIRLLDDEIEVIVLFQTLLHRIALNEYLGDALFRTIQWTTYEDMMFKKPYRKENTLSESFKILVYCLINSNSEKEFYRIAEPFRNRNEVLPQMMDMVIQYYYGGKGTHRA